MVLFGVPKGTILEVQLSGSRALWANLKADTPFKGRDILGKNLLHFFKKPRLVLYYKYYKHLM